MTYLENKSVTVLLKPSSIDFITRLQAQSEQQLTLSRIVNQALALLEQEMTSQFSDTPE